MILLLVVIITPVIAWRGGPIPNYPMAAVSIISIVFSLRIMRKINSVDTVKQKKELYQILLNKVGMLYVIGWFFTLTLMKALDLLRSF